MLRSWRAFVLAVCKGIFSLLLSLAVSIYRLHDRSSAGSVDMQDFRALHKFLEEMNQSFQMHDRDRSGNLDSSETHAALTQAGNHVWMLSGSQSNVSLPSLAVARSRGLQDCCLPCRLSTRAASFHRDDEGL